eukprot:XP_011680607.1 PREDICTED: solute carrier family 25 member 35-like [Strongylocentrotus purpuratus]
MPVDVIEFGLGGAAAACAVLFTNPLEVVKTRFQLQGELKAWGAYQRHYRNVFHAFYTIGRYDGLLALQAGLPPAIIYQILQNGTRLGTYQSLIDMGLTKNKAGETSLPKAMLAAGVAGYAEAFVSSPCLKRIYVEGGAKGFWRGVNAQTMRNGIGSMAQLTSFSQTKDFVTKTELFRPGSIFIPIITSMVAGTANVVVMTPLDVISTRMYNQGIDERGKGLYYRVVWDCATKIWRKEGLVGFYKGWSASWFRLAPQTVLSLSFWDLGRKLYYRNFDKNQST